MGSLAGLAGAIAVWAVLSAGAVWQPPAPIAAIAEWGQTCRRLARQGVAFAGSSAGSLGPTVGVFLLASLVYGGVLGGMSYARTRRFVKRLPIRVSGVPGAVLGEKARGLVARASIHMVEDPQPFAFTAGFLRPAVYVSEGMVREFSGEEIRSVFRHEGEHVSRKDPFRSWAADTLSRVLWFLPVAGHLRREFLAAAEEEADDRAAEGEDGPLALASALIKTARGQGRDIYVAAPGFAGEISVTERVERLIDGPAGASGEARKGWLPLLARSAGVVVLLAVLSLGGSGLAAREDGRAEAIPAMPGWMMSPAAQREHPGMRRDGRMMRRHLGPPRGMRKWMEQRMRGGGRHRSPMRKGFPKGRAGMGPAR
jgi:hypothetical protein